MTAGAPIVRLRLVAALVALRAALPLLAIDPAWEFHRDELLYFAMGDHLDLFRMQFPPLIAIVARAGTLLFGDAVWAARVPAALAGAALLGVLLLLARRLGGGRWSAGLLFLGSLAAPVLVRPSVLLQPVVLDQLWCALALAAVLLAAAEDEPRWWMLAGLGLGLGALTKFSVALYVAALAAPVLLVAPLRRQLATRWPWLGAAAAVALAVPSLTGQIAHDWPFLAQLRRLATTQLERMTAAQFLAEQPLLLGAATVLAVAGGLAAWRGGGAQRAALAFGSALVGLTLALEGKSYYAAPAYPMLLVTGALAIERLASAVATPPSKRAATALRRARPAWAWSAAGLLVVGGALLLPMGVPLLGPEGMARYAQRIGVTAAVRTNRGDVLDLPQDYADMLGWRALAEAVAQVYDSLPPADRARVVIGAANYGEAGALALYRRRFRYPYPVSTAGDFHAWGPGENSGEVGIVVGPASDRADLEALWTDVRAARAAGDPRSVPEERDLTVFVTRGLRRPLAEVWPELGPTWG